MSSPRAKSARQARRRDRGGGFAPQWVKGSPRKRLYFLNKNNRSRSAYWAGKRDVKSAPVVGNQTVAMELDTPGHQPRLTAGGGAEADDDQIPHRRRNGRLVVCALPRRQCVHRPDADVIIRDREHWRDRDRGFDIDAPAGGVVIRR
jgi:hypothetical protein